MTADGFSSPAVTLNEAQSVNKAPYDWECSSKRQLNENRYVSKPPTLEKVFKFNFLHAPLRLLYKGFSFIEETVVGA